MRLPFRRLTLDYIVFYPSIKSVYCGFRNPVFSVLSDVYLTTTTRRVCWSLATYILTLSKTFIINNYYKKFIIIYF